MPATSILLAILVLIALCLYVRAFHAKRLKAIPWLFVVGVVLFILTLLYYAFKVAETVYFCDENNQRDRRH
eukprot:CAMPEP_0202706982 /NCGR_PEP_ID=MMETSP1385-20130828/19334_1 /ASSEMBLY_ACC=CAM_ASM_000861 /TAXON_ID=933848 /ORGANISM="Elphidium margaritaceum" /LENGTH=70 /DNA_ID=CAMNT_0049365577 /DNA_START=1 /DNA_END=210 /DNA_ORIENTATION=+